MSIENAIYILSEELDHTLNHLMECGKDPEYYAELGQFATALVMGIVALRKEANK
jgi:hypothetical protein